MKVLSIAEAQRQLGSVCEQAVAGEVIRLQLANGALIELLPVSTQSQPELAAAYDDPEWSSFENRCAKSSGSEKQRLSRGLSAPQKFLQKVAKIAQN